jgi:hypothetical protein
MGFALGWLAFALAGLGAAPPADQHRAPITYAIRYVETDGLTWREAACAHLKPVARQGNATIWTAPKHVVARMLEEIHKRPSGQMLQTPKVIAESGVPAHLSARSNRQLVTQVAWHEDGQPHATPEHVRVGWVATIVGRTLDQGTLVRLVFEHAQIQAIHHVNLSGGCESRTACAAGSPHKPGDVMRAAGKAAGLYAVINGGAAACDGPCNTTSGCCAADTPDATAVTIDVPEISKQEIAGEWLIPRGECLVLSFGVHTVAGKDGKAVVKEQLATLEAEELGTAGEIRKATAWSRVVPAPARIAPPGAPAPDRIVPPPAPPASGGKLSLPMPVVPSRTIPQGVHADGTQAELPPLPADETESPASESAEPLPSPQKKKPQAQPKPPVDSGTDKAGFSAPKVPSLPLPGFIFPLNPASPAIVQFLVPIKPLALKLPFNQRLEIEIIGRVVPNNTPAGKPCEE